MVAIAFIIVILVIGGMVGYIFKLLHSANNSERDAAYQQIKDMENNIQSSLKSSEQYASKQQLETLTKMLEQLQKDLKTAENGLTELEDKLNKAQEEVEQKEAQQQDMKSSNEKDEAALTELLTSYEDISNKSMELEKRLADAMEELDRMMKELELTPDQRGVLEELSEAMSSAGALLRDLITEHNAINERLADMRQQQLDLEEEYTKLVERQLGGE